MYVCSVSYEASFVGEEDGSLRLLQEMTIVTHGNPRFCPLFAESKKKQILKLVPGVPDPVPQPYGPPGSISKLICKDLDMDLDQAPDWGSSVNKQKN
jgi:hypothetical protein